MIESPELARVPPLPAGLAPEVAHELEMAEARAYLSAYTATSEVPGDPARARAVVVGGATAISLGVIDVSFFNRVIGLGVPQPATREDVAAIGAFYGERGITDVAIAVANGAMPAGLPALLAADGYVPGSRWVKMWHDLHDLDGPSPDFRVEQVGRESADAFGDVILRAFAMPPIVRPLATAAMGRPGWTHYLGREGETPVAVAAMHVADGVAWLGYGGTAPSARGHGWQTAMFRRRLADARDAGCRLAVTETGEETDEDPVNHSYRNMVRAGFRLGYARRSWYRP